MEANKEIVELKKRIADLEYNQKRLVDISENLTKSFMKLIGMEYQ